MGMGVGVGVEAGDIGGCLSAVQSSPVQPQPRSFILVVLVEIDAGRKQTDRQASRQAGRQDVLLVSIRAFVEMNLRGNR